MPVRPPPDAILTLTGGAVSEFIRRMNTLGAYLGAGEVTSWWRDSGFNAQVGGAEESQHLIGTAADVTTPWPEPWVRALGSASGLIVLPSRGGAYHAQLWPASANAAERILGIHSKV